MENNVIITQRAAFKADDILHRELVRVYGAKRAGDMRYQPKQFTDRVLIAASRAKLQADAAMHAAFNAARSSR